MFNLLFDAHIIFDILALVLGIVLLIVFIKFKSFRVFIASICFVLYVCIAAISAIYIDNYYSAEGGIFGQISQISKPSVEVEDMSFDLKNLTLIETGNNNEYSLTISTDKVLKLSEEQHRIYVNNVPCNNISYATDYIVSVYDYVFYNENLEEILNDKLNIKFSFYNNNTTIIVSTNGGQEAVGLWNNYFNKNNFTITIK